MNSQTNAMLNTVLHNNHEATPFILDSIYLYPDELYTQTEDTNQYI